MSHFDHQDGAHQNNPERWTEDELKIVHGLWTLLKISDTSIVSFLKDFGIRTIGKRRLMFQILKTEAQYRNSFATREALDVALKHFTARNGRTGIGVAEIEKRYPDRKRTEKWSEEENMLMFALRKHANLRPRPLQEVMDTIFPGAKHELSDTALQKRYMALKGKCDDIDRGWLEDKIGIGIEDLKLMYSLDSTEYRLPLSQGEKMVLVGASKYLNLPPSGLLRFLRFVLKRKTFNSTDSVRTEIGRYAKELQSVVSLEDFKKELSAFTPLSIDELRKLYNDDPILLAFEQAIQDGFFEARLTGRTKDRDLQIIRMRILEKRMPADIARALGVSPTLVNTVVYNARQLVRIHEDEQRRITVTVPQGNGVRLEQKKPQELVPANFEQYAELSKSAGTRALWGKMFMTLEEKPGVILPLTVKARYANITRQEGDGSRTFTAASLVLDVLPSFRQDIEQVVALKNDMRGLSFLLSRPGMAKKLYDELVGRRIDIEAMEIVINVRNGKEPEQYRAQYISSKALGRAVIISHGK